MSDINNGGPAFPIADTYHTNGQVQFGTTGMSLSAYFAAHAPEIPSWFKRKEWQERVVQQMPQPPDGRMNWVHTGMKDCAEDPLEHLVRWRMAYAAAMVANTNGGAR